MLSDLLNKGQKSFGTKSQNDRDLQNFLKEKEWLGEVSAIPLQQSLRDLEPAYSNFFGSCQGKIKGIKVKHPRFKKRKYRQSAKFTKAGFKLKGEKVYLAKIGNLKVVWSRPLPSEPSSVTVIKNSTDRYFLSFVVEIQPQALADNGRSVGIDLGIATFATLSTGEKIDAPKPLKKRLKRLKKAQRNLCRKKKGSKRREKARKRVAKIHAKIKDTRTDFLQKLSKKIVRENQTIILEYVNTSGMVKNSKLALAIECVKIKTLADKFPGSDASKIN